MTDDANQKLPHEVTFSRYESDVLTRKRTLVHLPYVIQTTLFSARHDQHAQKRLEMMAAADGIVSEHGETADAIRCFVPRMVATKRYQVGDRIVFINKEWSLGGLPARVMFGTLIGVSLGPLSVADEDLPKLNAESAETYLDRWDKLFPTMPASMRPIVWRLEWIYGAPQTEATTSENASALRKRDKPDPIPSP